MPVVYSLLRQSLYVTGKKKSKNFTPQEYWSIETVLNDPKSKKDFNAKYYGEKGKEVKSLTMPKKQKKVSDAIANADFVIEKVKRGQQKRNPQPPFTTSTLQQDASRKYNFKRQKQCRLHKLFTKVLTSAER